MTSVLVLYPGRSTRTVCRPNRSSWLTTGVVPISTSSTNTVPNGSAPTVSKATCVADGGGGVGRWVCCRGGGVACCTAGLSTLACVAGGAVCCGGVTTACCWPLLSPP